MSKVAQPGYLFRIDDCTTTARIEATDSLLPHAPNRLTDVGIPNPLLDNRPNSFANTRTTP